MRISKPILTFLATRKLGIALSSVMMVPLLACSLIGIGSDTEEVSFSTSSAAFSNSASEAQLMFSRWGLTKRTVRGSQDARLPKSRRLVAPTAESMAGYTLGDADQIYDVVLQPGHFLRTRGATGASGQRVSEQALVSIVADQIARELIDEGLNVAVIPADGFTRPLNSYVFLALHADGSVNPCSSAPSMGYDDQSDLLGVHFVGFALAQAIGVDYDKWHTDNFTANLERYYAFKHMKTRSFEGILELGEITCPETEQQLVGNHQKIAKNLAAALSTAVTLAKNGENSAETNDTSTDSDAASSG